MSAEITTINLDTRPGRMLAAGRVTVTFTSAKTGGHITLTARCKAPVDGRWVTVPAAQAAIVYVEVPAADGGFSDRVAKITRRGGFQAERNADPARVWCAKQLLALVAGQPLHTAVTALEESRCGKCGRPLTDPLSIERGVGPECFGASTGSQHQTKEKAPQHPRAEVENAADRAREVGARRRARARQAAEVDNTQLVVEPVEHKPQVVDGKDAKGVPLGVGDWRARAEYARQVRGVPTASTDGPSLQLTELHGETFEDIFLPYQTLLAARS